MAIVKLEYYSTEFCGPCRMQKNVVQQFIDNLPYVVPLTINTEENTVTEVNSIDAATGTLATDNNVTNVPTIIIRDVNGNELSRFDGVKPKSFIEAEINAAVAGIV